MKRTKIVIRGISQELMGTMGKVNIPIIIYNIEPRANFHVVRSIFPKIQHGILGHAFLSEQKAVKDIANNTLLIAARPINNVIKNCFKLKARKKTIVSIPIRNRSEKNKNILIGNQE